MWPWGHLAVGYLIYVVWAQHRQDSIQRPLAILALVIGTQFPDAVDKPLAWTVTVLPSGRSFAHSLLTAGVIIAVLYRISQHFNRRDAVLAFSIGYVSHILSDLGPEVVGGLLLGDFDQLQWMTYLVWPLLPVPPYPSDDSFLAHFAAFSVDPYVTAQLGLFATAVAVWVWSGAPGGTEIRDQLRRYRTSLGRGD